MKAMTVTSSQLFATNLNPTRIMSAGYGMMVAMWGEPDETFNQDRFNEQVFYCLVECSVERFRESFPEVPKGFLARYSFILRALEHPGGSAGEMEKEIYGSFGKHYSKPAEGRTPFYVFQHLLQKVRLDTPAPELPEAQEGRLKLALKYFVRMEIQRNEAKIKRLKARTNDLFRQFE